MRYASASCSRATSRARSRLRAVAASIRAAATPRRSARPTSLHCALMAAGTSQPAITRSTPPKKACPRRRTGLDEGPALGGAGSSCVGPGAERPAPRRSGGQRVLLGDRGRQPAEHVIDARDDLLVRLPELDEPLGGLAHREPLAEHCSAAQAQRLADVLLRPAAAEATGAG